MAAHPCGRHVALRIVRHRPAKEPPGGRRLHWRDDQNLLCAHRASLSTASEKRMIAGDDSADDRGPFSRPATGPARSTDTREARLLIAQSRRKRRSTADSSCSFKPAVSGDPSSDSRASRPAGRGVRLRFAGAAVGRGDNPNKLGARLSSAMHGTTGAVSPRDCGACRCRVSPQRGRRPTSSVGFAAVVVRSGYRRTRGGGARSLSPSSCVLARRSAARPREVATRRCS
jgi:hypothetical protein